MFICKLAVVLIFALLIVVILEKMQKTTVIGGQPPRALGHVQTSPGDHDTSFWRYWRHL